MCIRDRSIDARISKGPGIRTIISHPETKTMTHYLRYHHDGILIGSGTVLADDPGLNCKWAPDGSQEEIQEHSPRPIILDTSGKWKFTGSKMHELFLQQQGKPPIIIVDKIPNDKEEYVEYMLATRDIETGSLNWFSLTKKLREDYNINSIMIEGGAKVIKQLLLKPDLVNSLVITIGSTFLGKSGVEVSPDESVELSDINWWKGTTDTVMCARLSKR